MACFGPRVVNRTLGEPSPGSPNCAPESRAAIGNDIPSSFLHAEAAANPSTGLDLDECTNKMVLSTKRCWALPRTDPGARSLALPRAGRHTGGFRRSLRLAHRNELLAQPEVRRVLLVTLMPHHEHRQLGERAGA